MSATTRPGNTEFVSEPHVNFETQPPSPQTDGICERCRSSFAYGRSRFLIGEYAFLLIVEWLGLMKYYPLAFLALSSLNLIPKIGMFRALLWFSILMCFVSSFRVWANERRSSEPSR